eukprot:TRINITY_DN76511_c0_g1_i1.p1 TRINITY_DN76511_c0_g1~~TRINITY_DN76511_c0_g1_i1.p1  ORF type:complete len:250 (-),score=8.12 TRINITY_DN76511_c0_g1_i1:51-800(-)
MSNIDIKNKLCELQAQREVLEIEADAIVNELTSVGPNGEKPAGIKDPLVDEEGFPRNDIDIYHTRTRRGRLAVISTDHKHVMMKIENELPKLHATFKEDTLEIYEEKQSKIAEEKTYNKIKENDFYSSDEKINESKSYDNEKYNNYRPIAIIDEILDSSPAEKSGLKVNDKLLSFGDINTSTVELSNALSYIPEIVKKCYNSTNENDKYIDIIVLRNKTNYVNIKLKPAVWSGRGLLGCHLTPIYNQKD